MNAHLKIKQAKPKAPPPALLEQAIQALTETTGLHGQILSLEPPQRRPGRTDATVRIAKKNEHWDFSVELRNRLTNASLGTVIAELRQKKVRGIVVTPQVTLQMAEKLRALEVPFLDAAGNTFLDVPGLFVFVSGKRMTEAHPADKNFSRAFRPSGLQILFTLLCNPGLETQPFREIAAAAGLSLGAIGWEMKQLEQAGYLLDMGSRGRRLTNQAVLLKRWVTEYQERSRPKLLVGRFSASKQDWWKGQEKTMKQLNAYWGGEVAAEKLTGFLKPQIKTIYTHTATKELQLAFGLKRDPQGEVEILKPFWTFAYEAQSHNLTPELLVYADLLASADERNLETAQIIYDRYLARLIGEASA